MFNLNHKKLEQVKSKVEVLSSDFINITMAIGHSELEKTARDIKLHLSDPFLFVIVGEVKSGKSSFINALLSSEKEICKVAPSPMTDTIQQVMYGDQQREEIINPYLKRIYQPVEILKDIAIVDTPGTNTIIEHHQEITERFVPSADLIVFVFEAKNPYRESAWKFFDYINEDWWKKVIFILQQKDLLNSDDLKINHQGLLSHALKKGLKAPMVFDVSAKLEHEGDHENSGFIGLRKYINQHILNGKAPVVKQQNNLRTLKNIHNKIADGVQLRKDQYLIDKKFRDDIRETLDENALKSSKEVDVLIENLVHDYNKVTQLRVDEIKDGLSFIPMLTRSFGSTFGMKESPKDWLSNVLKELERDLNIKLRNKLNDGVIDIADSIQQMGKIVDLKIRNSQTVLKDDSEIFSDIAEKRANVLKDLQKSFANFLNDTENFYDKEIARTSESISPNLAAASGITAVGVILAAVTNGMVFDITGGVLTTAGILFAGVSLGFKRRKILKDFAKEIDKGKNQFKSVVEENLKSYINRIRERIELNFQNFDTHLLKEDYDIQEYERHLNQLNRAITENELLCQELIAD